jgi:hypothetical protein
VVWRPVTAMGGEVMNDEKKCVRSVCAEEEKEKKKFGIPDSGMTHPMGVDGQTHKIAKKTGAACRG